jgi:hypothetical protein
MICIEEQHPAFERYRILVHTLLDLEKINQGELYKDIFKRPPVQFFLCGIGSFVVSPNSVFSFVKNYLLANGETKCLFFAFGLSTLIAAYSLMDGTKTQIITGREGIEEKLKFFELDISELDTSLSDFVDSDFQLDPMNNDGFVFFSERGNWLLIDSDRLNLCLVILYDDTWRKSKPIVDQLKTEACDLESIHSSLTFIYLEEWIEQFYDHNLKVIERSLKTLEEV